MAPPAEPPDPDRPGSHPSEPTAGTPAERPATDPFQALLDTARWEAATSARRRRSWWRQYAAEQAQLGGVVADLVDAPQPVVVTVADGSDHRGMPCGAGPDHLLLDSGTTRTLIPLGAIQRLRAAERLPDGARPPPSGRTMAGVLGDLVDARARVVVHTAAGTPRSGVVVGVGRDVLRVDVGGAEEVVPLAAIVAVQVLG